MAEANEASHKVTQMEYDIKYWSDERYQEVNDIWFRYKMQGNYDGEVEYYLNVIQENYEWLAERIGELIDNE